MPIQHQLSHEQRHALASLLQSRLDIALRIDASQPRGLSQAETAHEGLMQDADDASQRVGAREVEDIVGDISSAEINAFSDALKRIHGSGYGICVGCQAAIPFARLSVEPQALRCAVCQTAFERSRARRGSSAP